MASWVSIVDGVAENVRGRGYSVAQLEDIARHVPLTNPGKGLVRGLSDRQWEYHTAIGAALERVLWERYRDEWVTESDAEVFSHLPEGEEYRDRVDRARSDAMHRVLEERHPELGDPGDSFLFHPEGTTADWRAHLRTFYGIAS